MAYLKTENIHVSNKATSASLNPKIYVNTGGEFYCSISEEYINSALGVFGANVSPKNGKIKLFAHSLDSLKDKLIKMLAIHINPVVTESNVILYNIESHVSFAENDKGEVFPNAGYEGSKWPTEDKPMYGDHHACKSSRGGYSLTIGAKAYTKITHAFGKIKKTEFNSYYKNGTHLGTENPAELLNSWCSFSLPDDAKEMPYSDEAALFFHNLMLGMARLSKMVQSKTFDQKQLLKLIESGQNMLPAPPSKALSA